VIIIGKQKVKPFYMLHYNQYMSGDDFKDQWQYNCTWVTKRTRGIWSYLILILDALIIHHTWNLPFINSYKIKFYLQEQFQSTEWN
jgi:hypothetical protein